MVSIIGNKCFNIPETVVAMVVVVTEIIENCLDQLYLNIYD